MILALALLLASPPPVADVLRTLQSTVSMNSVAISRDGKRVAFMEKVQTPDGPAAEQSMIYLQDLKGGPPHRITAGRGGKFHDEDEPAFSTSRSSTSKACAPAPCAS